MRKGIIKIIALLLAAALLLSGCGIADDAQGIIDDIIDGIESALPTEEAETEPPSATETLPPETAPPATAEPTEEPTAVPTETPAPVPSGEPAPTAAAIDIDGEYNSRDDVALYIHTYGHLPKNFITKDEAYDLGWNAREGNLWDVAYGKSIGGDVFGNREGLLPKAKGRTWFECDIGYEGGYRGGERIVFSNDGLIYYSASHYESFERLY